MSSLPVMTSGVLTGMGGGLSAASGVQDLTGLGGLFGALMNGTGGAQAFGAGMSGVTFGATGTDIVADAGFDIDAFFATQSVVEQTIQLTDEAPAITVKGDAETVNAFMAQVKEIYQKVIVDGGLDLSGAGDSAELAGALQELGMDAETAQGVAARVETMMQLVEEYHGKDEELDAGLDTQATGTLAAMMLAVMGQSAQPTESSEGQTFSLQISTTEQTLTVSSRPIAQISSGSDVLASLREGTVARDTAAKAPVLRVFQVDVVQDGEAARVGMILPETHVAADAGLAAAGTPVADIAVDAKEITLAARAPVTVQAVSRDEIVTMPEGETYYTLAADANGTETVEAVKPLPTAREQVDITADIPVKVADVPATTQGQWMQQQRAEALANPAMSAQAAASGTGYAEQYEAIQGMLEKSQVGRQVNMQIQPLLEQGGGTIRLQLTPVELGQVTVELTIAEGKVHGAIAASEPRVVEQLARDLHSLRQGLADAGLKVGEQGINLMLSSGNGNGQFGQQGQNAQTQQAHNSRRSSGGAVGSVAGEIAGDTSSLASNLAEWVSPDRMLDVNV
jgi:Flagellar hook-length control protein FliK